jgi:hypothetical protein
MKECDYENAVLFLKNDSITNGFIIRLAKYTSDPCCMDFLGGIRFSHNFL